MQIVFELSFFFYKATPLKNVNFCERFLFQFFCLKIFTLSTFHSLMCWNGRDFRKKYFLTLDHMGTPLKNKNFENRTSTRFKLAQIRPRAKISWSRDFWWLRKTDNRQIDRQGSWFLDIIDIWGMNGEIFCQFYFTFSQSTTEVHNKTKALYITQIHLKDS